MIEVCVETYEEAIIAKNNNADALELCSNLDQDGLTPDFNFVSSVITATSMPCKIMIRPHANSYYYDSEDINTIIESIKKFKSLKIEGFVFGALKKSDAHFIDLDLQTIYQVCKAAFPHSITIHKAIDQCTDILHSVQSLLNISNVNAVLTSGGKNTAFEGVEVLQSMQDLLKPNIHVIAAGKITPSVLQFLQKNTTLKYFHGRRILDNE